MGVLNFIVDMGQSSQLSRHEEEIEKLTKRIEILEEWIRYYERTGQNQTCRENRSEADQIGQEGQVGKGIRT